MIVIMTILGDTKENNNELSSFSQAHQLDIELKIKNIGFPLFYQ